MAEVVITDHALVRFLERVGGIDMTTFKDHIAGLVRDALLAGATSIRVDGFLYVLEPQRMEVKTVLDPEQSKRRYGFSAKRRAKCVASVSRVSSHNSEA